MLIGISIQSFRLCTVLSCRSTTTLYKLGRREARAQARVGYTGTDGHTPDTPSLAHAESHATIPHSSHTKHPSQHSQPGHVAPDIRAGLRVDEAALAVRVAPAAHAVRRRARVEDHAPRPALEVLHLGPYPIVTS